EIKQRTAYLVKAIREKHPKAPIIVMQTILRESGYVNQRVGKYVKDQNVAIQNEVLALLNGGMKDLYFITSEQLLGNDHEGSIDGTHPNDLGYFRMASILKNEVSQILNKYNIKN